jgi:nitrate reductase alpha subunit
MIGGYAQLSYALNYYGTIGSNRDEMVLVRRLERAVWAPADIAPVAHVERAS